MTAATAGIRNPRRLSLVHRRHPLHRQGPRSEHGERVSHPFQNISRIRFNLSVAPPTGRQQSGRRSRSLYFCMLEIIAMHVVRVSLGATMKYYGGHIASSIEQLRQDDDRSPGPCLFSLPGAENSATEKRWRIDHVSPSRIPSHRCPSKDVTTGAHSSNQAG